MNADLRHSADPEDVAVYWFTKRRASDMTPNDVRAFEVWIGRDPAHQSAFRKVENTWAMMGEIEDDPAFIETRDKDEGALAAQAQRGRIGALAAGAALAAGGGWVYSNLDELANLSGLKPPPAQVFRTSIGQRTTVTLLDGSTVTLDTDTVLRAQLSRGERRIELAQGQAFFQVAKEKYRPFVVVAAGKTVRATGTAFDVRVEPGRFEVTLIEGRVQVREEAKKLEDAPMADMRQGWRLAIGEDARWRMEPVDLARETMWHDGMLAFFDKPLEQAVGEVNRYSKRKIVFRGEPPKTFVLGRFETGDVESFVRAVELNKLARVVSRTDERIELAAR